MLLFGFDKVYLCPHQQEECCSCRKPLPGMLQQAASKYDLDLSRCVVIGDRWTDLVAANEVGAGEKELMKLINNEFFGKWAEVQPDYVAKDLEDAINWLLMI